MKVEFLIIHTGTWLAFAWGTFIVIQWRKRRHSRRSNDPAGRGSR